MRLQTLSNIQFVIILIVSFGGIGFGFWSILNDYPLGLISLAGGVFGLGLSPMILQAPFGYGSWDEYENPSGYSGGMK